MYVSMECVSAGLMFVIHNGKPLSNFSSQLTYFNFPFVFDRTNLIEFLNN